MIESMQNNENSNVKDNENVLLLNRQKFLKPIIHREEHRISSSLISHEQKK
jgi:hypothetical protein